MLDFFLILILLLVTFWTNGTATAHLANKNTRRKELNAILIYHCVFIGLFTFYILSFGGDSTGYWRYTFQQLGGKAGSMFDYYGISTTFPLFLNYIPARILGLSYFTGNFIYGILGFIAIRFIYLLFCQSIPVNIKVLGIKIIPGIFFLPNLHFWTAGVGKDVLCFLGIAWFLYSLQNFKKRFIPLFISFLILFHARPHIGAVLIVSAALALIFTNRVKLVYKVLFTGLIAAGFALIYSKLIAFLKIDEVSVESLENLANAKVGQLNHASVGSSIDLANYSVPYRFFTFLYRPLFFDAHNIVSLFSSFENLLYLFITFAGARAFSFKYLRKLPVWLSAGTWFFIFSTIIFANSLSNLGIIMRMKNMSIIYFVLCCLCIISLRRYGQLSVKKYNKINQAKTGIRHL